MRDTRHAPGEVIALFGPTGVGKTAIAVAVAELLRARGEDPVAVSADALQVYAGLETLTGVASDGQRSKLEHRLVSFLPLDATFSAGQYAELAHAEIDALLASGRRPIVVGGTGLYLRAALADLDMRPPPPEGAREHWTAELERHGAPALHALLVHRAAWAAEEIDPNDRRRVVRALELLDAGELEPPEDAARLWSAEPRHPTLLAGLTMERDALYALIDARVEQMLAAGARDEVRRAHAAGASDTARQALGFQELLLDDVADDEASHPQLRTPPAHVDAKASGRAGHRRHRPRSCRCGYGDPRLRHSMRFEKWQALGNDYLILEREELPFALTPPRVRRLCESHFGVFADGVLELSPPEDPAHVADLRIFNPDGSEAELSGNGAREAILYLRRRGWTDRDSFSIHTAAGTIRPTITGPFTCRVDMGQARLRSGDFPQGPPDGAGELLVAERMWRFRHVSLGNPQCAISVADVAALAALDLDALGPPIEGHPCFPNRTNVSWYTAVDSGPGWARIRARIFERGVGETLSSGTGATGAAIAHALGTGEGAPGHPGVGGARVTVVLDGGELEVEVSEDLHVHLSGWALPVFEGRLSEEFLRELGETV